MRHRDIERPRGIADVAASLLDLDFPIDRDLAAAHIEHILVEDRDGRLVSAAEALNRSAQRGFLTSEDVVMAVAEGLGLGILEVPLSEVTPAVGATPLTDEQQAASSDADQLIDQVERDGGPVGQVIQRDADAERAEARERLRGRQRAKRYELPDGPEEEPALDDGLRPEPPGPAMGSGAAKPRASHG